MSVTYAFFDPDQAVLGYFSLTNDSIKKEDLSQPEARRFFRRVPHRKRYSSMPTVKIGRLGVSQIFQSSGIGTKILDYLKVWFTDGNKTGCRFLVVDASNNARTIQFYARNGFEFLTTEDANDETRIMFFDLKTFRP